ncbi:MAG: element excision factor XisH family protein, partial [Limnothrix sp.]|nr:element excision factor XisH family protein [Limnothrix sp.]
RLMPAKDLYHNAIKNALITDGWTILADPYRISYEDADLYADLAAARPLAVAKDNHKIVVEIKTFSGPSPLTSFHAALGQYVFYRDLIRATAPEFDLYLATDHEAYQRVLLRPSVQLGLESNRVNLFVVDLNHEVIALWKPEITT